MTRKQYNNIVQWTLSKYSSAEEDSLAACRAILKNLGIPFPNGDYREILRTLMSNEYMGWNTCTMEQAIECTDQGIPAIGISKSRVLVLAPEGTEEPAIDGMVEPDIRKALAPSAKEISLDERMDMQFFAYAFVENSGILQRAGQTIYPSPRYVKSAMTSGVKIRHTPDGAEKTTLSIGSVLLVNNVSPENAGGKIWINVTYYEVGNEFCKSDTGWIAVINTGTISKSIPDQKAVSDQLNRNLKGNQLAMLTNARYIHNYFRSLATSERWTNNAIYAMLGNMVQESTINPNKWYNSETGNLNGAYGLTQWHRPTKYFNWLIRENIGDNDETRKDIMNQLRYIKYEVKDQAIEDPQNLQWLSHACEPYLKAMSFYDFTKSWASVSVLTEYFLRCYEKPGNESSRVVSRQNMAKMVQSWIEEF